MIPFADPLGGLNEGLTNADVRVLYSAGTRLYAGTAGGGVFSIDLE